MLDEIKVIAGIVLISVVGAGIHKITGWEMMTCVLLAIVLLILVYALNFLFVGRLPSETSRESESLSSNREHTTEEKADPYRYLKDDNALYWGRLSPEEESRIREAKRKGMDFGSAYSISTAGRLRSKQDQELYKYKLSPEEEERIKYARNYWNKI